MAPIPEQSTPEGLNEITEKYKEILHSNGIKDKVSEVIIKDAGLQGEGFASLTQYVTIKFENPDKKPLNLFAKVKTDNPSHTKMLEEMKAFEKESRFLVDYVKEVKEMCSAKGRPEFIDFYPKCYYGDENMIVLENLVLDKGYTLKRKEDRQDLESAKFAIKTLAKHHAIAHVMIKENGGPTKFFQRFPNLNHEAFYEPTLAATMEQTFPNSITSNIKILEKNDIKGAKEAIARLKSFMGKPMTIIKDALKSNDDTSFLVLNHGDYWNNNMMFLMDKERNEIIHHVAIDWQVTRYNSPALDLGYYFFTSVKPDVRQAHLREMLELYTNTVNSVTEEFGHPTNLIYEDILLDYRKMIGFGFWFGFMMAVGPGIALFKDLDITKIDLKDWAEVMNGLVNSWIDEYPAEGAETAEENVKIFQEYEELRL